MAIAVALVNGGTYLEAVMETNQTDSFFAIEENISSDIVRGAAVFLMSLKKISVQILFKVLLISLCD